MELLPTTGYSCQQSNISRNPSSVKNIVKCPLQNHRISHPTHYYTKHHYESQIHPQKRDRSPSSAQADGNPIKRPNVNWNQPPTPGPACPFKPATDLVYDLNSKTTAQLKSFAKENNIYLKSRLRKAEIVENIIEACNASDGRVPLCLADGMAAGAPRQVCQGSRVAVAPNVAVRQAPVVINAPAVTFQQSPVVVNAPQAIAQNTMTTPS